MNVDSVTLAGEGVRLELLPLGATLHRFEVQLPDGSWRNIVLGSGILPHYVEGSRYIGSTLGRIANRLARGRFVLDGVRYVVVVNEPPNQLHGGADGFDNRVWTTNGQGPGWVEFALDSANGDQGFPGELEVTARYELVPAGVQVTYRATTAAPTVVNLTTHPYFNLDGEESGDITGHRITINASRFTPTLADGVPTGEIRDVAGTGVDFREGRQVGRAIDAAVAEGIDRNGGLDHNFVVDGEGLREHCRLTGAAGLTVTVFSDRPAVQVYTGDHFDGTQQSVSGGSYLRRAGIALETQGFPDAPNHPNFPSIVLRPGEEYATTTRWQVSSL